MPKQLVTIKPDGSIEGLQMKKGRGLDLRQFGPAAIKRITNIEWNEEKQCWNINFLLGQWANQMLCKTHADLIGVDVREFDCYPTVAILPCSAVAFEDYDEAVKFEIAIIQAARRGGKSHLVGSAN